MFIKTEPIPMTGSARNSLIAVSVLWVVFATTVGFRFLGRICGIGPGLDDVLSAVALILAGSTIGMNAVLFTIGMSGSTTRTNAAVVIRLKVSDGILTLHLQYFQSITFAFMLIYIWCPAALKIGQLALYFAVLACFGLGGACVNISLARFIQIYAIDLIGNLTGTSLTTFMLCTVELMLAGLCTNIPMLQPFYIRLRVKYKSSSMSNSGGQGSHKASGSRQLGAVQVRPANYMAWIEW
ncbi:hypothetical protein BU25DRAFT_472527 [Macroventuria anomochaeta]|uniref:Uncharacterized protein n=1 Tax=Macroventuria anomochaeta TaxID=301207 RepID=A0ACB6RYB7_9PLEO|nr:uncharacterized protein BU25DRAFT_472527 [Macroventuria anomochaeta]KAF2626247.1 hypothetical protein BU25DRAFT_472527 [Macroventuria anomochaeta]